MSQAPIVTAVSRSSGHTFSKPAQDSIVLIAGIGVEGDAHAGVTDQHRSHVARTPDAPNLRQVHLIHSEFHEELIEQGFAVAPGQMGENLTTMGVALLDLPTGALLHIGDSAVIEITGLRNPCKQLNGIQDGLMQATLEKREDGTLIRKCGVMSIVIAGGEVQAGDRIRVELPDGPHIPLEPV